MTPELLLSLGAGLVAASATYFITFRHARFAALRADHRHLLYQYAQLAGKVRRLLEDNNANHPH